MILIIIIVVIIIAVNNDDMIVRGSFLFFYEKTFLVQEDENAIQNQATEYGKGRTLGNVVHSNKNNSLTGHIFTTILN